MFTLILALSFIGLSSAYLSINWDNLASSVTHCGSPSVQFLTPDWADYGHGLFYDNCDQTVCYVDHRGTIEYNLNFGTEEFKYNSIAQSSEYGLAFIYPQLHQEDKFVIGTYNTIISANLSSDGKLITNKSVTLETEAGYGIWKAHADKNGNLFLILNSKADKKRRGGRLYRFVNQDVSVIRRLGADIMDFAWSHDYTYMYLLEDNGRTIIRYKYNMEEQSASRDRFIFRLPVGPNQFKEDDQMTGIETSNIANTFWVTTNCGKLLQIRDDKIIQTIIMPVKYLTGITYGGLGNTGLIISTSKECGGDGAGSLLYVAGINGTGISDVAVKW